MIVGAWLKRIFFFPLKILAVFINVFHARRGNNNHKSSSPYEGEEDLCRSKGI
jgi:hypothetical protein